jgi:hypothetical protein
MRFIQMLDSLRGVASGWLLLKTRSEALEEKRRCAEWAGTSS